VHQRSVTEEQLLEAHRLLVEFVQEFEDLYYQRKATRLHFCRQSIHALLHLVPEVIRLGPGVYYTQWTMERTIGNLGEEIKQPSQPFANLSERGLRRCQVNALKSMLPQLEPESKLPRVSIDLGNNYILLGALEEYQLKVPEQDAAAIREQFIHLGQNVDPHWQPSVRRWARLCLPNGQIVRSAWKEKMKPLSKVRMARNVMVSLVYLIFLTGYSFRLLVLLERYHRECIFWRSSVFLSGPASGRRNNYVCSRISI
jgi:hypothetical protein